MSTEYDDLFSSSWMSDRKDLWVTEQRENRTKMFEWLENMLGTVGKDTLLFRQYLDIQAKFIQYSTRNTLLILKQFPQAERLGDSVYWRNYKAYIKRQDRNNPILILEPGPEYTREDNSVGTYYNVKKVYDVTQTTFQGKEIPKGEISDRMKLQALIQSSVVPVRAVEKLPDDRQAYYDPLEQEITIMRGMSATKIFHSLSCELAHVELEQMGLSEEDRVLTAYCAAYILCVRYGFDTSVYDFAVVPAYFEDMETRQIAKELGRMRDAAWKIAGRVDQNLEVQKVKANNEWNRQER